MNRKKILVIGVGSIGERHVRCFASTGRAEVSICDVNGPLREAVAKRYHLSRSHAGVESALGDSPEAVVICTPAHQHIAIALAAARTGAHLLIEKPLSTSMEGIEDLRQEAIRRRLVVAVAYVYRAHPVLTSMRDALRAGRFGAPVQVIAASGQHFPHYRPAYRDIYYRDRATGGGAVQDALTHLLNAAEWLVGPATAATADFDHQVLAGVEVEDTVHVLTRHEKVMGCFHLNQHQAPNETTLTVICERGTARFEAHRHRWRWLVEPGGDWHDETPGPMERDELFVRQANCFLDALEGKRPPPCTLDEAEQTLRVALGILMGGPRHAWLAFPKPD